MLPDYSQIANVLFKTCFLSTRFLATCFLAAFGWGSIAHNGDAAIAAWQENSSATPAAAQPAATNTHTNPDTDTGKDTGKDTDAGKAKTSRPVPTRLQIKGTLLQADGSAAADTEVTLIGGAPDFQSPFAELDPVLDSIRSHSDAAGHFQIGFDVATDRGMIHGDPTLLVRVPGHQIHWERLKSERMRSDAPLNIELRASEAVAIQVLTAEKTPVADAKVGVAVIATARIAVCSLNEAALPITDAQGNVTLDGATPETLDAVYVLRPGCATQRVPLVTTAEGQRQAILQPTRVLRGQINAPNQQAVPDIQNIKIWVASFALEQFDYQTGIVEIGWGFVPVAADGSFTIDQLPLGTLMASISCDDNFPWRQSYVGSRLPRMDAAAEPFDWNIEFQKQDRVQLTLLDENDQPLPNISIVRADQRLESIATNDLGQASFFRVHDRPNFFARDVVNEFFSRSATSFYSPALPVDGIIQFEPVRLTRRAAWTGRVVDEKGEPISGAKIFRQSAQERFNLGDYAFSNSNGTFSLGGVADEAVKLYAFNRTHRSETVETLIPDSTDVILKMVRQPIAAIQGRLLDSDQMPLAHVSVAIQQASEAQGETNQRALMLTNDIDYLPRSVRTDSQGRFAFPPSTSFARKLRFKVRDPDLFEFNSPLIDGTQLPLVDASPKEPVLDVGTFQLMRRPSEQSVEVMVYSEQQTPVANAEIVFIGARNGKAVGQTGADGKCTLNVKTGTSVLAVRGPDHRIHFGSLHVAKTTGSLPLTHTVSLLPTWQPRASFADTDSFAAVPAAQYKDAAERLMDKVPVPDLGSATYYRGVSYLNALVDFSPEASVEFLRVNAAQPAVERLRIFVSFSAMARQPDLAQQIPSGVFGPQLSSELYLLAARHDDDPAQQAEWLSEALIGASDPILSAKCIDELLRSNENELAVETAQQMWENAVVLRQLLESGQREAMIAESRLVATTIALVDLESALKLIPLTALEDEIRRLQVKAILNWGLIHPDQLFSEIESRLQRGELSLNDLQMGVSSWCTSNELTRSFEFSGIPQPLKLASMLESAAVRIQFLLLHASLTPDPDLRRQMMQEVINAIRHDDSNSEEFFFRDFVGMLVEQDACLLQLEPAVFDEVLFATLVKVEGKFESSPSHLLLANLAHLVSIRDRKLARTLIEAAVVDRGWIMADFNSTDYWGPFFRTIGRFDPQWSVDLVDELIANEFRHDSADELDLRVQMIKGLMESYWLLK